MLFGKRIKEGDIVFHNNPEIKSDLNNMISQVLSVNYMQRTAIVRGRGYHLNANTTSVVSLKNLQRLKVNPLLPIQVPAEPQKDSQEISTSWKEIPLSWFRYVIP